MTSPMTHQVAVADGIFTIADGTPKLPVERIFRIVTGRTDVVGTSSTFGWDDPTFTGLYAEALASLHAVGARETLRRWESASA